MIYRLGIHVSVPGVNAQALTESLRQQGGGLFDVIDLFSGARSRNFLSLRWVSLPTLLRVLFFS